MRSPHVYRDLSPDKKEELFSNFLIDSWSYSKVNTFSRNEKAFEMQYIYNCKSKRSSASIAGNAYHAALDIYFTSVKNDEPKDLVELEKVAFEYIDSIENDVWKTQKTTPSIEECKIKATKTVVNLLSNFFKEKGIYEFSEVICVEEYYDEYLTINGVDLPLPCHSVIDLVIQTIDGKVVIIDHKSKQKYTDEKEVAFTVGKQAITYYHSLLQKYGLIADEVWFVENKHTQNRDKSPQLQCFKVVLDDDTLKLYEALLYEPLKRMLEAVADPDYVYVINESDNFVDRAEIYEFWGKTMMQEIDDFAIPEHKREMLNKRIRKIRDSSIKAINPNVIKKFKANASNFIQYNLNNKNLTVEEKIEHTLKTLGVIARVAHTFKGYSSNTYLLEVSAGTNISSVFRYKLDIANALNVPSVIMKKELFLYEGNSYLAIEAGKEREEDLIFDPSYLKEQKIPLGLNNFNQPVVWDLNNSSTPHMLICGATGSGKSVAIKSIIEFSKLANVDEIVIFDPKFEFLEYKANSFFQVLNEIEDIENRMAELVVEMNESIKSGTVKKRLIVFDEFADALSMSRKGKDLDIKEMVEVGFYAPKKDPFGITMPPQPKMKLQKVGELKSLEENLKILLQKGRSIGFRIIAATQRASVKVITGDAKVNFPVQVCFRVPKEVDSKVVLDESGAETLSGKGDGLIKSPEYKDMIRFQSFYKK